MEMEKLKSALKKIDEMIYMAKTDKSIDIKDLRKERQNTVRAIKALKNYTPQKDDVGDSYSCKGCKTSSI